MQQPTRRPVMVMLTVESGQPIADLVYTPGDFTPTATDHITVALFNKDGFVIDPTASNITVVDQAIADYPDKTPKMHRFLGYD